MRNLLLCIAFLLTTGASAQSPLSPTRLPVSSPRTANIDPKLAGVWQSLGDGYLLKATSDSIILFSFTSRYCYRETNEYLSNLLNTNALYSLNASRDTLSIYLQALGPHTVHLQTVKRFIRLPQLPLNCAPLSRQQRQDPEFLFELFVSTLRENYAFTKERKLNWGQIYQQYRSRVSPKTTLQELFQVMGDIVSLTKDQHTKIIAKDGKTKQYSDVPTALRLKQVFDQQDSVKDFNQYVGKFFTTQYQAISQGLLGGKGQKAANGKIEWGSLDQDIGYIHIHALTGFTAMALPRRQQLDTLNFYMQQIMQTLQQKKALIIDVSFNFGGYDAAGLTIAGYFTKVPVAVYKTHTYHNGNFYPGDMLSLQPAGPYSFSKPVYLLTTDITRSAGETFALQLRALPNVRLAGTPTLGILSDMLGKTIGDYYLTLSNQKYLTPDGRSYETTGVPVEESLEVFPTENMFHGHRNAVLTLIKSIRKGWEKPSSKTNSKKQP